MFLILWINAQNAIIESYGSFMFSFLKNCQHVFQSHYTISYPRQQHESSSFSTFSLEFSVVIFFSCFKNFSYLVSCRIYYTVVLFCISIMTSDVEHRFLCLFITCIYSSVKNIYDFFCFSNCIVFGFVFIYYWPLGSLCIF